MDISRGKAGRVFYIKIGIAPVLKTIKLKSPLSLMDLRGLVI